MDKLYFANGVQVHSDGESVIVAETPMCRLWKVPINGDPPRKFGPTLPGTPDNVRSSPRGGYWVALGVIRHKDRLSIMDWLGAWPQLRRWLLNVSKE